MGRSALQERVLTYLANHQVMTLATHGADGVWAAAVFYVNDGFTFYFLSAAHTRHARHITATTWAAATIQEDYRDWEAIRGIQMAGRVQMVAGDARETAVSHYLAKYPFVNQPDSQIAAALDKVNWYQLVPQRLYFIDNSRGLGHRDRVPLP